MSTSSAFDRLAAMVVLMTKGARVGRTALNKLLWFADVAHLLQYGRTISGTTYARWQFGPVPAEIDTVRRTLIMERLLKEQVEESTKYRTYAYEARSENVDFTALKKEFSESELRVIKAVKDVLRGQTGAYLSEMSHRFEPWISARPGEDLDLSRAQADEKLLGWMKEKRIIH